MIKRKIDMDAPINPFIRSHKLEVLIKNSSETRLVNIENLPTGDDIIENPEVYGFSRKMMVDPVKHLKIFLFVGIEEMFDMPKTAIKLFINIGKKLQWNQDLIKISLAQTANDLSISESSVANALNNLIDNGFLCKYKRGYYWINPIVMFYGDRLKTYKDNLKIIN